MYRFPSGKIPTEILRRSVFPFSGAKDPRVLLGPSVGEDAAVIAMGRQALILTTDPITGTDERIGWLSVHINANDAACRGARPLWYLANLLLPPGSTEVNVRAIMRQIDRAARELGISVVGGHSEITIGLDRPIVVGFIAAETRKGKYVTTGGARPGDDIIMTKTAGIEGTAILAAELERNLRRKVSPQTLKSASRFFERISVVEAAMTAIEAGGVHALHDPTEGGVIHGLWEIAEASNVGMHVHEANIPIAGETVEICSALRIDPLKLISSGSLLISADRRKTRSVLRALVRMDILCSRIGRFLPRRRGRRLKRLNNRTVGITPPARDELYRVLERFRVLESK
jgi:hydrogenase maturation factor